MGYNTSYLSTKFKKKTNISLKKYILNEKLKTAEELLIYSKVPVFRYSSIFWDFVPKAIWERPSKKKRNDFTGISASVAKLDDYDIFIK